MNTVRKIRRTRVGIVVSDKMDKTVVVRLDNLVKHPEYKNMSSARLNVRRMMSIMTARLGIRY